MQITAPEGATIGPVDPLNKNAAVVSQTIEGGITLEWGVDFDGRLYAKASNGDKRIEEAAINAMLRNFPPSGEDLLEEYRRLDPMDPER